MTALKNLMNKFLKIIRRIPWSLLFVILIPVWMIAGVIEMSRFWFEEYINE